MSSRAWSLSRTAVTVVSLSILTAAFLWPALVTGAPWSFPDTASYYAGGAAAWSFLMDGLGIGAGGAHAASQVASAGAAASPAADAVAAAAPNVRYGIRSVPYSITVYALVRFVGLWAPIVAMSFATAGLVWLAARDLAPGWRLLLGLGLAATTVLPFFGSLFQPDILTALIVLIPIAVMLHGDWLGRWAIFGLFVLMAYATLSHYSNLPLAAVSLIWLAVWGILRGRRFVPVLAAVPVVAVVGINLAIGVLIDSGPSLAPGRFPLLLARSIEDGPGYAYLTKACPEADWAMCEIYDRMPSNIGEVLWGERSLSERATPQQLARVSAEEIPMLMAIVRSDPAGQIGAFLANGVRQFFLFGGAGGRPAAYEIGPRALVVSRLEVSDAPAVPQRIQVLTVVLGVAAMGWATIRRRRPEALAVVAFLAVSLVVYALVCGGLSAPVPRYQARLIWLVPLLGAILAFGHPPVTAGGPSRSAPRA